MFDSVCDGVGYRVYNIFDRQLPPTAGRGELHLITGSNSAVYDRTPWVEDLLEWIKAAHRSETPMAGICFGHQAVARALGGRVERSPKGWGTGIRVSQILTGRAGGFFPDGMALHYNHHDQVTVLPAEAELFATSAFCKYDGFTVGNHIVTFQGHPEYTDDYNLHLLRNHSKGEPEETVRNGIRSIQELTHNGRQAARMIAALPSLRKC